MPISFISYGRTTMLCFRRHALTFLPTPGDTNSRLLCLRHYRVSSEGCTFTSRCGPCSAAFQEGCRHLVGNVAPEEPCSCNVCKRQPPTLLDMASRTVFTVTRNVDRFRLTRNVTHSEFVHSVNSGWASVDRGLPPDYPDITVRYRYHTGSGFPFHPYCNPSLDWHVSATRTFGSPEEAISELAQRLILVCGVCEAAVLQKPLRNSSMCGRWRLAIFLVFPNQLPPLNSKLSPRSQF
jgi:hypothetical protein